MRIKGSGSDLKSIEPRHFPGIRLDDLEPLYEREAMSDDVRRTNAPRSRENFDSFILRQMSC